MTKPQNACMCALEPGETLPDHEKRPVNKDGVVAPAGCFRTDGIAERSLELQGERRALWLSEEQEVDF
ncbi:MAG: hypothetical protein WBA42_05230 [Mesorhizobium sp.]